MATPISCDPHNGAHLADWLVTQMENGESLAYCNDAYLELMIGTVEAVNRAEADQADAAALARLEATQAPDTGDTDGAGPIVPVPALPFVDQPAQLRDGEYGTPPPATPPDARDVTPVDSQADDLERRIAADRATTEPKPARPVRVVRRGQGQRARTHRENQERRAQLAAGGTIVAPVEDPDDGPDDDDVEAGAVPHAD